MSFARLDRETRWAWARVLHPWRHPSEGACEELASDLPAILDNREKAPVAVVAHVEYCLACQAEVARYHKLLRLLCQLRTSEIPVPPGVVTDVLSSLEGAASRRAVRSILAGRRVAYGSAAVAAAGAGAGLVAWTIARGRRPERARATQRAQGAAF
ncbi:MAG: hypothetical protein ACYCSF_06145 [Acidimicrobiales bacterium]